jgi:hypothetical protein
MESLEEVTGGKFWIFYRQRLYYKDVVDCRNNGSRKSNFQRNGDHVRPHVTGIIEVAE